MGNKLVSRAIDYCKAQGCHSISLFTTDGLPESLSLYEKFGFRVTSSETQELWDGPRPLIRMDLALQ